MVHIDMNRPAHGRCEPGVHLAKIVSTEVRTSKGGDPQIVVQFHRVPDDVPICKDWLTLGGDAWGITKDKLEALGIPRDFDGDFDAGSLQGRTVWIAVAPRDYKDREGRSKTTLSVDIGQLRHAGYQALADVPAGCVVPKEPTVSDMDVPF